MTIKKTPIGWCDYTANFYNWFCTKTGPECQNCYVFTLRKRYGREYLALEWRGEPRDAAPGNEPIYRKLAQIPAGSSVFLNDMSDTYHEDAPGWWIHRIHNFILTRPDLSFIICTKRPERAYYMRHTLAWPNNLWFMVTVGLESSLWRLDYAFAIQRDTGVKVAVSGEPQLEMMRREVLRPYFRDKGDLDLWIAGGESGGKRRPFEKRWAVIIRNLCLEFKTDFFFKQGSAHQPGKDRLLLGKAWNETPWSVSPKYGKAVVGPGQPYQLELFGANA